MRSIKFSLLCTAVMAIFLIISPTIAQINTIENGGFENVDNPAYWQKLDADGAVIEWATDQYRSPERSLKISDTDGLDAPSWKSENFATLQWNPTTGLTKNIEMLIGGWVKTQNVNIAPATDNDKITLSFTFKNAVGATIFGQSVILDIPQNQASTDWVEIKNDVPVVLPEDAAECYVEFKFGANATGTAWLDDIFLYNAPGAEGWIGGLFNANFGVPAGWFFWKDKMDNGEAGYGVVSITNKYAHKGTYSLHISDTADNPSEVVAISHRNQIDTGRSYGLSAWVKLEDTNVNPTRDVEQAIFFTITYHNDNAGWAEIGGEDFFVIDQSMSDTGWRLYEFTFTPPAGTTRISLRPRMQHQAIGDTYWDDIRIYPVTIAKKNFSFDESLNPAYWSPRNGGEADVEWASDEYRSPERSLKISDADGDDDPYWISANMAKLNWNSTTGIAANVEMEIGGWVKTQNVNTNPANANAEITLSYSFYDATGNLIFGQPVVMNIPQTNATTDWVKIQNETPVVLPVAADSLVIMLYFGPNATGTVWLDDIFMKNAPGAEGWLGDLFNGNFGVPDGWFFWKDKMSEGEADYGVVSISDTYAHSGIHSLRMSDDASNPAEVVPISDRNPVEPNKEYLVSVWVKLVGTNLNLEKDIEKAIFFTVTYHSNDAGWAENHGTDFLVVPQTVTDRDWALYTFRIKTEGNDHRISIRGRMQHQATGDVYMDDFQVVPIASFTTGYDFESADLPAYWTKQNEGASTLSWTPDVSRSPQRSLMIQESDGDDAPMWITHANMAKLQWNSTTGIPANVEMEIGGWVKTENVNTNPANADAEIQLVYEFYAADGVLIFGQPVIMNIPQTQGTSDWVKIMNETPVVLPVNADSMAIIFKFGPQATGTAWLDDIFMKNAPGAEGWLGDLYNGNFGVPEGWFFWKDKMSEGEADYGVVSITDDAAHTGNFSLLLSDDASNPAEVVAISNRNPIQENRVYTVQAWVKTDTVTLNPEKDVEKSIFFTATYHNDDAGWAEFSGQDFFIVDQSVTSKDWTLYVFTVTTPENTTRMSIRARMQHQATGKVYWDDFAVVEGNVTKVIGKNLDTLPIHYVLSQNYPNPFNPSTMITFALPNSQQVQLVIYNLLGEKVRTLVNEVAQAGQHQVMWDGRNDNGQLLSSGAYFYVLETAQARMTRRMTLLK